jgi:pyoverdine/dityrosine biosynthesis protein Dit1
VGGRGLEGRKGRGVPTYPRGPGSGWERVNLSHPVLKVNRMRTIYVPGSEIHVHSDYMNDSS